MEALLCFRLWSHCTRYLFVAPRKAIRYSANTYTCIQHVTLHLRDRRVKYSLSPSGTEITSPQSIFCVNRSPIRYGFRGGAKDIRYQAVNMTSTFTQFADNSKFQGVLSLDEFEMNGSEMMPSDSITCMFVF